MLKNHIRITWRNLWEYKFYTGLNIFGLSIGIACLMILFQFTTFHLSFDKYHRQSENIYRIVTDLHLPDGSIEYDQGAPIVLGRSLKMEASQVKDYAVLLENRSFTVSMPQNGGLEAKLFSEHENIAFASQQWFHVFDYNWEGGNANTALEKPNTAVITKKLSEKYFGSDDPIGEIIKLDNKHDIEITGVLEDYPSNTDIQVDMFLSLSSIKYFYPDIEQEMTNQWDWVPSTTSLFVLLHDEASQKDIDEMIANLTKKYLGDMAQVYQFHLQPLEDVHFNSRYGGVIQKSLLATLAVIGFLLIIIASVNFINLATAQSAKRAKEVGIRKVLGSSRSGVFWQFITETACITLLSLMLAIMWIALFLPLLNDWLQTELSLFHLFQDIRLLSILIIFLIFIVFAAGFYPAIILSRFKPVHALKGMLGSAPTASLSRKFLIVAQNVIAYGRDLLVDGGRFAYRGELADKFSDYARGSYSHNVILIDGQGQAPGPKSIPDPLPEDHYKITERFDYAWNSFDQFNDLKGEGKHTRALFYRINFKVKASKTNDKFNFRISAW